MTYKKRLGFTLMELLIVLAILIALLALLLPAVFSVRSRWLANQAQIKVNQIAGQLEQYAMDNRGYPTTEQGLLALIYIPDNVGVLPTVPQPGAMGATDPAFGGMAQGSVSVGAEALANPAASPMGMPPTPGAAPGGMTDSMAMSGSAMPPAVGGITDPTAMGMGAMGTGAMGTGGMMASTWTQPTHNPQLYMQQRKRSDSKSYAVTENDLIDPWGTAYRYDNSLRYYGFNQTGSAKPAVWSAGPDKADGTDDDIRNWDPVEANKELALRQQQGTMGTMGVGQTGTVDPTTGMPMTPPAGANPMGTMPMTPPAGANPMGTMPMTPPAGANPMGTMPMTPPAGANPMGTMPMTPPAGANPMGTMPMTPPAGAMPVQ